MTHDDFELGPLADVTREIGEGTATLIFTRTLRHPPGKIWRALTEPTEQLEWMPFVSDRALDDLGPAKLRMTDGGENMEAMEGEVLESERARLLRYRWGSDLLTWELKPHGASTLLTLRHMTKTPEHLSSFAAGWHICIAVAERFMDGRPIGPVVGPKAMDFGWAKLNEQYQKKLQALHNG
ncbi:MAG TPA: SRPBCC domain-containing protein [Sphingobium sp.]|uniref:SRPBCC domain-containing protein n=1 Tax=Sphingobium sp. TaxID=1912891 RepID=UPI002ED289AD